MTTTKSSTSTAIAVAEPVFTGPERHASQRVSSAYRYACFPVLGLAFGVTARPTRR